jgi:hypothetical protein
MAFGGSSARRYILGGACVGLRPRLYPPGDCSWVINAVLGNNRVAIACGSIRDLCKHWVGWEHPMKTRPGDGVWLAVDGFSVYLGSGLGATWPWALLGDSQSSSDMGVPLVPSSTWGPPGGLLLAILQWSVCSPYCLTGGLPACTRNRS